MSLLVIFTFVGFNTLTRDAIYDWRPIGEFYSVAHCQKAAQQLALSPTKYRCIATGK